MSYKAEQAARHALLSHYCAIGDTKARDRMIQAIEAESKDRSDGIGLVVKISMLGIPIGLLLKIFGLG
jgi:hypothetical protein